ncbi:MAG: TlyA family RNA methyltransferase [bacterium]|nr:TlyA family RNA methyltransferase [bacterium]
MAKSQRLDKLLVERNLAPSRERAQRLILAGRVSVNGQPATKAGVSYPTDAPIEVLEDLCPYVSRGGLKLAAALNAFGVSPEGRFCLDAGASTGGFTDVLLRRGARRVVCVDVGKGILDWSLRGDARVLVMEETNARHLTAQMVAAASGGEWPDLAVADLSFISLRKVLPAVREVLIPPGEMIVLIKPQFEVGKGKVGKGGIVRDAALHDEVLREFWDWAASAGYGPRGALASPLRGAKGNREFFLHLRPGDAPGERDAAIGGALAEVEEITSP